MSKLLTCPQFSMTWHTMYPMEVYQNFGFNEFWVFLWIYLSSVFLFNVKNMTYICILLEILINAEVLQYEIELPHFLIVLVLVCKNSVNSYPRFFDQQLPGLWWISKLLSKGFIWPGGEIKSFHWLPHPTCLFQVGFPFCELRWAIIESQSKRKQT